MADLGADLLAFDGRHTDVLESIAGSIEPTPEVIGELCDLAATDNPRLQVAATWILKHFRDNGTAFGQSEVEQILDLLGHVGDWEARLHLLQLLPGAPVPQHRERKLYNVLTGNDYLHGSPKFVRAWTYNALAELADRNAALRPGVGTMLASAEQDEAASIRARIRNIRKQMPWARVT